MSPELREADLVAVRAQLGREPTVDFEVVARCGGDGHPLAIRNAARAADGTPFPTTFWLTCPDAVKAVARLESGGAIGELNVRADADPDFATALEAAHAEAARDRAERATDAEGWGGVAGTRAGVKCLHAHYANRLGGGDDPVGAWVAGRVEPVHPSQRPGRVAVIDQGTNSCRLLVVEPGATADATPVELARDMVITRLGQGVDETGRLAPEALARTDAVLARYGRRAHALGAERIRVGATSAVRDAENREVFAEIVFARTGADLEVVEGTHEAALSFLGGTRGLDPADGPFLVLDIGGGSTEFVVGHTPGVADQAVSMQMGSVRLTERLLHDDPPSPADLAALRGAVATVLDEVDVEVPVREARTFVSVAGTATTVAAIALDLDRYDPDRIHRTRLSRTDVARVADDLAHMTNPERAAIPVMAPGRGDVIVAGAEILLAVMRRFGFEETIVSETDILDGLAFELLDVR